MISCADYSYASMTFPRILPSQHIHSTNQFLEIPAPTAIFFFFVICDNTSLRYLPISFNQAIGTTTPFFTTIFAFLITCKQESAWLYLALLPIVLGIIVASNNELLIHLFGFIVCLRSTMGRAFKSVVQGILLTSEAEKLYSMILLLYIAPMVALILLSFTFYIEGDVLSYTIEKANGDPFIVFLLVGNATMAYSGNAKAAVAVVISVFIFKNPVMVMRMEGFAVTVMDVVLLFPVIFGNLDLTKFY